MSVRMEKEANGESALVIDGFEQGMAPSPHMGIGLMTGVDISTEQKEVMASFSRTQQSQTKVTSAIGALSRAGTNVLSVNTGITGGVDVQTGSWITISNSTIAGLNAGTYYVISKNGNQFGQIQLSNAYSTKSSDILTGFGAGTADFITAFDMTTPVGGATERYQDTTGAEQYRYYMLDANGRVYFHDTIALSGLDSPNWALPYTATITGYGTGSTSVSGFAYFSGYIFIMGSNRIFAVATCQLGTAPTLLSKGGTFLSVNTTTNPHFAFAGHQTRLYYTDGNYVGSMTPDITIDPDQVAGLVIPNIQSYCSYTAVTTTGTITGTLNGSFPADAVAGTSDRIPVYFYTALGGTLPTAVNASNTKFYAQYIPGTPGTFNVFAASSGGAALDIATGAVGAQYFNTFAPFFSTDGNKTWISAPQKLTLPSFETATCIAELGNNIIVGTKSNVLYVWNQTSPLAEDLLPSPENNCSALVTVNNVVYIFAGYRGNIYVTNGSAVSLAIKVPDYASGLVEPYFTWGGTMYLRGRLWFSLQDQTASHTGQCGGIWSFVPIQNFYLSEDIGQALRMDNKNSYVTTSQNAAAQANGYAPVLIAAQGALQQARGPQYWAAWVSSVSSPLYGIDFSNTVPTLPAVIQTDLIPTGSMLQKRTFKQVEYKLSAPLVAGDTVTASYRLNATDAFTALGTAVTETSTDIAGYFVANFQNTQWLQLQIVLTPNALSTSSFVRLKEIRIR